MKSRTSFFDKTVLRKDLTRFAPLWALYLIGGLLLAITFAASSGENHHTAQNLSSMIGPFSVISLCYAILSAQLLFGDLFNTRLCNALHAMPLRREGWFFTHVTAGILYSLVPNTLISLALMPFLGEFWYTALLWLLGMELHYLFFFGLAAFCMMLTGNRFAAAAVYAIFNSLSAIALWFCNTIFAPMLYGVVIREEIFSLFCPVWALCGQDEFFTISHSPTCSCAGDGVFHENYIPSSHQYYFGGFSDSWGYLILLAVLGIVLGAGALMLYRKRHLESAGNFMAFTPIKPVFTVIYTLCAGALLQIVGNLFDDPVYVFLIIGLVVGYFTSQMLLNRTLRVFKKKNWLALVLIFVLVFGGMGLCRVDAFGLVRWVPDVEDVVSVKVADSRVNEFTPHNTDAEFTNPDDIAKLIAIHKLLYAEGPTDSRTQDYYDHGLQNLTLCYKLKDGREVYRQYRATVGGKAEQALDTLIFCNPMYVLNADSLEGLLRNASAARVEGINFTGEQLSRLLTALWDDCQAGTLRSEGKWEGQYMGYVEIVFKDGHNRYLDIFENNKHTTAWIKKELMQGISVEDLINNIACVFFIEGQFLDWYDSENMEEFCLVFTKDNQDGLIPEGKLDTGIPLIIQMHNGMEMEFTVPPTATTCYTWLQEYLGYTAKHTQ